MSDEQTPENLEPEDIEQPNDETPESDSPKDEGVSVESLQAEIAELKEGQLRLAAARNIRRRAEADVEKARKFGTESLIKDLLPVADSLSAHWKQPEFWKDSIRPCWRGWKPLRSCY